LTHEKGAQNVKILHSEGAAGHAHEVPLRLGSR
jgi:hypothetical protein